jgi:hypothetical protein
VFAGIWRIKNRPVYHSGPIRREIRRRAAVEPVINRLKAGTAWVLIGTSRLFGRPTVRVIIEDPPLIGFRDRGSRVQARRHWLDKR